jgi:integrase
MARNPDRVAYLTEAEVNALFAAAARSPRDLAILRVTYHRGLRASEVGLLQLSDFDERSERLTFRRLKGSIGGIYHLTANESRVLRAWLRVRGDQPGPLFPGRTCDRGISRQQLDVLIKRYGEAAGIPQDKRHMHALKHSCGTHLFERGENIEDVQDHLGHRNIQNTLIYAKITNPRRQARDRRLRDW